MLKLPTSPPENLSTLIKRAEQIAGLTLGELGEAANILVPEHFKQHKGFTGQLIDLLTKQFKYIKCCFIINTRLCNLKNC